MKIKKKTLMLASFALGTLLFASTALADIVTRNGYDQLKDGLKLTAENFSDKMDSFTLDISAVVKDNGKTLISVNSVQKYDRTKNARENITSGESVTKGKTNSSYYSDKMSDISYSDNNSVYHVTEYPKERKWELFDNPFKENRVDDLEKIADALVGSLKDYVVVTENPDGSKLLSGSLSEVQIPSLVNALASFQSKQVFNDKNNDNSDPNHFMPNLTQDIFVKEVKGSALLNKDGVIENILGTAVLCGTDEQGQFHSLTLEVLGKVTGINSTTVSKPDLTGKKVIKHTAKFGPEISNPQQFIGKFKNNIIIEKDGKFIKIGERFMEITQIDNETVKGRYYEEYKPGFAEYADGKYDFSFDAHFDRNSHEAGLDYTDETGNKYNGIYFDEFRGKVYLNGEHKSTNEIIFDSTFSPVLE